MPLAYPLCLFCVTFSLQPPLATLFFLEARTYALVNSNATFISLSRFLQGVFSVGIGFSSSRHDAADSENSKDVYYKTMVQE
ncbi:hypothetical protein TNCV_981071 [Trichonephila clavipes]|uniref:Secreted protein n=1 Tax=Trichonephila clavipes TaxID=2585209 RepID=A0A8X6S580_TRICX|nr:hypothetical protein TNCV_981071 [Trichonephila clavipes]